MLLLISPAKTLDTSPPTHPALAELPCTQPQFLKEAAQLVEVVRDYSPHGLAELMHISAPLAALNHQRYADFALPLNNQNATPAIFAFKGDVYRPLPLQDYDVDALTFMHQHVRILSGLYGVLRPLDLLYPYRLEMGTSLICGDAKNLYQFWGEKIAKAINEAARQAGAYAIVNLASQEYVKAVQVSALELPLIHIEFKEKKGEAYKIVGIHAKAARGMMVDYVTRHRLSDPAALEAFDMAGYRFAPTLSDAQHKVFVR
jgi:cytoplasmic iron level regulating protein YaaA (DUF328/UPF0246 family)